MGAKKTKKHLIPYQYNFKEGELVLAKIRGFADWPAKVITT